jgi:hypothetical protein
MKEKLLVVKLRIRNYTDKYSITYGKQPTAN